MLGQIGPGAGNGPVGKEFLGRGVKKKKKEMGWAEREGERERIFHFPK